LNGDDKPLDWLHGKIKTPPFSLGRGLRLEYYCACCKAGQALVCPMDGWYRRFDADVMSYSWWRYHMADHLPDLPTIPIRWQTIRT